MANHGYVKTKQNLDADKLKAALDEINMKRFRNLLRIERQGKYLIVCVNGWDHMHRPLWLASKHKIELRHEIGGGNVANWIEAVITNDLALAFNGLIYDDGVEETWAGEEGKYPTLAAMLKLWTSHHSKVSKFLLNKLYGLQLMAYKKDLPKEWRDLLGKF